MTDQTLKDIDRAFKALEERDELLDKIKEDIKHLHDWAFTREEILRIIDKYKAESEGKEEINEL